MPHSHSYVVGLNLGPMTLILKLNDYQSHQERCEDIGSLIILPAKSGLELYSKICIRLNVAFLGFVVRMLEFLEEKKTNRHS